LSTDKTKQSVYPTFARNFNRLIGYKDKSDRQARSKAAEKLGVKYENVRIWSEGHYLPKGEMLLKIKKTYNVSVDWLLSGDGSPPQMYGYGISEINTKYGDYWQGCSEEVMYYCKKLRQIIESDDHVTATAIKNNIDAFDLSLNRKKEFEKVKKEVDELKKAVFREPDTDAAKGG